MADLHFFDKAGHELKKGDLIVYGHALGRCAGLRYGKVLEVTTSKPNRYYDNGKRTIKLKIIGCDDDWGTDQSPSLLSKASVLEFSARILKLHDDQVPPGVLELLRGYRD